MGVDPLFRRAFPTIVFLLIGAIACIGVCELRLGAPSRVVSFNPAKGVAPTAVAPHSIARRIEVQAR